MSRVWSRSQSQIFMGNLLFQMLSMVSRLLFKVRVSHSAELRQWMQGGASWYSTFMAAMCAFSSLEASLSRRCSFGRRPHATKAWVSRWYALRCYRPVLLHMGSSRMALEP